MEFQILDRNKIQTEAVKKFREMFPTPEDRKFHPVFFMRSLNTACKLHSNKYWRYFLSGTQGEKFRNTILEFYTKSRGSNADDIFSYVSSQKWFIPYCCFLLVKLFDAQTFKKGEILRRQTRIDVLGQEVYDGYKSFKSSHIDPRYNLRITIPFKYAQYFPHASDETSPDVLLDESDSEDCEEILDKKIEYYCLRQKELMKSQQSLKNKLENVSSRMNLLKESMRQTLEEQTAKELIKNHMKSLMGFLTADDSVVERCFANLKRFLEVHKSSHLQTEASIKHCLDKYLEELSKPASVGTEANESGCTKDDFEENSGSSLSDEGFEKLPVFEEI